MEKKLTLLTKAILHQLKIVDLPGKVEATILLCDDQVSKTRPTEDEKEEMEKLCITIWFLKSFSSFQGRRIHLRQSSASHSGPRLRGGPAIKGIVLPSLPVRTVSPRLLVRSNVNLLPSTTTCHGF